MFLEEKIKVFYIRNIDIFKIFWDFYNFENKM